MTDYSTTHACENHISIPEAEAISVAFSDDPAISILGLNAVSVIGSQTECVPEIHLNPIYTLGEVKQIAIDASSEVVFSGAADLLSGDAGNVAAIGSDSKIYVTSPQWGSAQW